MVSLILTAATTYDGYLIYDREITRDILTTEIVVPAGQAGKVYGVEWKAAISPMKPPASSKHGPEVAWLQVDITEKIVDAGSATMTALPSQVRLNDRAGRIWTVEIQRAGDEFLGDKLDVGQEYKIIGAAVVPVSVVNEVELSFKPSDYRSDTPTKDLFKRQQGADEQARDTALRFRRR
ncbi:hypothetical protein [Nonomuraea zeae]|uniref:Uncharacterized protein n=1 Tax=Nonomuraea zeae TaxID=1642303 RepID=A0A5S4H2G2_9ACTN|nr:hypothetical protein [Nonomuraea zeae]TMR39443.1 hypothetical protein ETD85_02010 [Nonomuraea zeae]